MNPEIQTLLSQIAANIQEDAVAQVREHLLGERPPANLRDRLDLLVDQLRAVYHTEFTQKVVAAICGPDATPAAPKSKAAPKKAPGFQHPYGFKKDGTPKKKPGAKAKVQGPIQVEIVWSLNARRFICELPDGRKYQGTRERDLARRLRQMGFEPVLSGLLVAFRFDPPLTRSSAPHVTRAILEQRRPHPGHRSTHNHALPVRDADEVRARIHPRGGRHPPHAVRQTEPHGRRGDDLDRPRPRGGRCIQGAEDRSRVPMPPPSCPGPPPACPGHRRGTDRVQGRRLGPRLPGAC